MENIGVKHGTFDLDIKTIFRELISEGFTKKLEIRYYWDSHGKKVWDFQPAESIIYPEPVKYELYREVKEYNFEYVPKQTYEFLELYFNGDKLRKGEITLFRELKTKIKLEVCVGAG
jgi:hypothetical protein